MKFVENINKNQKKVKAKVVTDSLGPRGLYIVHGILQPEYLFPSPGDLPSSGIKARSPTLHPLGWTGWISLQSKGLSRVFSNTTVQKHQFFGAQLSL